jgi:hypothetical protein
VHHGITNNTLSVTYDDQQTDEKRIVRALISGGVVPRNVPPGTDLPPVPATSSAPLAWPTYQ